MEQTREAIVKLSNNLIRGQTEREDLIDLIVSYCVEHGKDKKESTTFVISLLEIGILTNGIINQCLEYYQSKFNICIITNIKTNEILSIF